MGLLKSCCGAVGLPKLVRQIVEGHLKSSGLMTVSAEDRKVSEERLMTCYQCPYISINVKCSLCGCGLAEKSLVMDAKCPDNRW